MAGLWDDATAPFTGQPPQDSSSLWGWLTSLFSNRQPAPAQPQPQPPVPTYTGPGVDPSLYPGAANWSAGAPASLQYAPPSLYTAANPQQQALWNQASTPQGWTALAAAPSAAPVAGGGGSLLRVPLPERKPQVPPPDGGWQGWAGVQGLQGGPSGPAAPRAQPAAQPDRTVSDEDMRKFLADNPPGTPGYIWFISKSGLTTADRIALDRELGRK